MLSLLELALWKTKLDQVKAAIEVEALTLSDEQNIDYIDNSGDGVIISNVNNNRHFLAIINAFDDKIIP
jgi:hypothetical protein